MRVGAQFASVSKTGCRWLQETGIPAERITWLPNGVDVQRFSRSRVQWAGIRERVRGEFNLGPSAFVVGCVGSLSPVKRIDLLLEAAARTMAAVPNLFVFIVGDGPLATPLENQCVRLGIRERVRFTSRREDVADLLTVPDVFVGSSDAEGMSNAVLEAMAAGLPVIATRVGDNPILIRDGIDGLIIEPNDPAALESALVRLTRSPAFCAQLGMAAHERAKEFDFPSMVRSYRQFYESLIDFKLQTQRPPRVGANGQSVSGPSAIRWSD
jgi:glycosyltransferase involved in cell wall biosynthesis